MAPTVIELSAQQAPGRVSHTSWQPDSASALAEMLRQNFHGARAPVTVLGGGTSSENNTDVSPRGIRLHTRQLSRVIDYPHRDMTITVEAGITLAELDGILAEHGQRLPVDAPFPERITLGAAIASNIAGAGRYGHGTLRDYVIGISAADGQGRLFSAGGRVVKNVAGYDLCKLLIGSAGALAVITQVSLKLKPRPAGRDILSVKLNHISQLDPILEKLNLSAARPVALDVTSPGTAQRFFPGLESQQSLLLLIALEGSPEELNWQAEQLQQELVHLGVSQNFIPCVSGAEAQKLWLAWNNASASTEFEITFQIRTLPSRVSALLEAAAPLGVNLLAGGDGVVWGGLLPRTDSSQPAANILQQLFTSLRSVDPQASLRIRSARVPLSPELLSLLPSGNTPLELWRGIKQALDPANILYPADPWLDFLHPYSSPTISPTAAP